MLIASLIFFAWGGVSYSAILIGSIIINYFFGLGINKHKNTKRAYRLLTAGVSVNLLLLIVFKYTVFFIENCNVVFNLFSWPSIALPKILLPIGISFYTFHSISYLIDIYRGECDAQKNILNMALYICMFPQLIAGPIIRYSDVWKQLTTRTFSVQQVSSGIERFLIGLGKKVLLANTFAIVADIIFDNSYNNLYFGTAWLGIICYSMQIYFDFSGYSDMAIGLGRMFGFEFMENFNFPFLSKSVKEFWRRWHISLSTWFNNYVFNPFVTAKRDSGKKAVVYGLMFTFFLSGFWHGAGWNFIIFGLLHGAGLVYDFLTAKQRKKVAAKLPPFLYTALSILFTYIFVCFTWVFFRTSDLSLAMQYLGKLFTPSNNSEQLTQFYYLFDEELILVFIIAIAGSLGAFKYLIEKLDALTHSGKQTIRLLAYSAQSLQLIIYTAILFLCTLYLTAGTYNPFIYFRF